MTRARRLVDLSHTIEDGPVVGFDRDLGAEFVHRQALQQRVATVGGGVEQDGVGLADQEQVEQQPAGRGEQGAEAEFALRQRFDVLGQQIVQEVPGVGAGDADQGAAVETGDAGGHTA